MRALTSFRSCDTWKSWWEPRTRTATCPWAPRAPGGDGRLPRHPGTAARPPSPPDIDLQRLPLRRHSVVRLKPCTRPCMYAHLEQCISRIGSTVHTLRHNYVALLTATSLAARRLRRRQSSGTAMPTLRPPGSRCPRRQSVLHRPLASSYDVQGGGRHRRACDTGRGRAIRGKGARYRERARNARDVRAMRGMCAQCEGSARDARGGRAERKEGAQYEGRESSAKRGCTVRTGRARYANPKGERTIRG